MFTYRKRSAAFYNIDVIFVCHQQLMFCCGHFVLKVIFSYPATTLLACKSFHIINTGGVLSRKKKSVRETLTHSHPSSVTAWGTALFDKLYNFYLAQLPHPPPPSKERLLCNLKCILFYLQCANLLFVASHSAFLLLLIYIHVLREGTCCISKWSQHLFYFSQPSQLLPWRGGGGYIWILTS
jgi:hypothetical protein